MRTLIRACVVFFAVVAAAVPSLLSAQTPAPSLAKELAADGLGRAAGRARSEEVMDDLDRAVEVEHALGFVLERFGDGGDRVRRGQGVLDGGRVAGVVAEQRRVRAVQRRDEAGPLAGREHRAREDRGGGVGHGVVDVEHVETVVDRKSVV